MASSSDPRELTPAERDLVQKAGEAGEAPSVRALRQAATDLRNCAGAFHRQREGRESAAPYLRARDADAAVKRVEAALSLAALASSSAPCPDLQTQAAQLLTRCLRYVEPGAPPREELRGEIARWLEAENVAVASSPVPEACGRCGGTRRIEGERTCRDHHGDARTRVPHAHVNAVPCPDCAPVSVGDEERKPDRLVLLAKGALHILDDEREATGVDEWDESDPRCFLYNAATAILERDANAAYVDAESAERLIDDCLEQVQP